MRLLLTLLASLALTAATAQAQTLDKTFGDWSVFKNEGSCYIASAPTKSSGNFKKRGQPYLLVVNKNASTDEINASSGYPYAAKSEALATIGNKQVKLFTQGNVAWAYDAAADAQLVAAMKSGNTLTLRGKSKKGTWSEDRYSLTGFTDAHARMKTLCR